MTDNAFDVVCSRSLLTDEQKGRVVENILERSFVKQQLLKKDR
jgi:hypothetical protein